MLLWFCGCCSFSVSSRSFFTSRLLFFIDLHFQWLGNFLWSISYILSSDFLDYRFFDLRLLRFVRDIFRSYYRLNFISIVLLQNAFQKYLRCPKINQWLFKVWVKVTEWLTAILIPSESFWTNLARWVFSWSYIQLKYSQYTSFPTSSSTQVTIYLINTGIYCIFE